MRVLCFLYSCLFSLGLYAQEVWTLEQCIEAALKHNIQLEINQLNQDLAENEWKQNKWSLFPNLSTYTALNKNYGRSFDPSTDGFVNSDILSSSQSISAGLDLTGYVRQSQEVGVAKYYFLSETWNTLAYERQLKLEVLNFYTNLLNTSTQISIYERQMEVVTKQVTKTNRLFELGKSNKETVLQFELEQIKIEQQKNEALHEKENLMLAFKQLLGIETSVEVKVPTQQENMEEHNSNNVEAFLLNNPQLKQQDALIQYQSKRLKAYQFNYLPSLSLNFGAGAFYSSQSMDIDGTGNLFVIPFQDQLRSTFNYRVGLSLNIPLFNGFSNYYQVKNANINLLKAQKQKELEVQQSRVQWQKMMLAIRQAEEKLNVAEKEKEVSDLKFKIIEEKYALGLVDIIPYSEAFRNKNQAATNAVQAQYDLYFKQKALDVLAEPSSIQK